MPKLGPRHFSRPLAGTLLSLGALAQTPAAPSTAQPTARLDAAAATQIATLLRDQDGRSVAQRKLDAQLYYAAQAARGQALPGLAEVYATAVAALQRDALGRVKLRVRVDDAIPAALLEQVATLGGAVEHVSPHHRTVIALVPLAAVDALAARAEVRRILPVLPARTRVGSVTSQGYVSHKADRVVASGVDGTGVRVGVLSDSASAARIRALVASGDLGPVTVLPDQAGSGSDEGTAMLEIVHDLAPGAALYFATAFGSEEGFADNIRALRFAYHCDVIVDDVGYFDEPVFQDGIVAQAINDVTADGALYFSAAGNSGDLTSGTSGTWEGDFTPAATSTAIPGYPGYTLHVFNGAGQQYDRVTNADDWIGLHWADPLGRAGADYDLFLLNSAGTRVTCASTNAQRGSGDPLEYCSSYFGFADNSRIVVGTRSGAAPRALHIDTERGRLSIATSGASFGHAAARSAVGVAAVYWDAAGTGLQPFVGGAANPTEAFSSDGPRRIFFAPDGAPITPGNFLFATNGGAALVKPDLAAADGVATATPGFDPFYGTSAAAPHAAAIAALVKSARPDYSNAQILAALRHSALDIRAPGVDRDSGAGIAMAQEAVAYARSH
ncbi:MAG: S8 family serine peptidase [Pelomonas sp.]|nr:S8 family serine peptidase [Roseateles sp.]